jgi:SAM-dependent methyltransferase
MTTSSPFDETGKTYQQTRMAHWNTVAKKRDHWRGMGRWYHRRLTEIYKFLVSPNQRVLEIGCGMGNLIASLNPSHAVGVDFSAEMIARAKQRHPDIEYHQLDAHDLSSLEGNFDVIILSDTVNDLWDVQRALEQVKKFCTPHTRLILNFYSHLWQLPLTLAQSLNLAAPMLSQNWLTPEDVDNLLRLAGLKASAHPVKFSGPCRSAVSPIAISSNSGPSMILPYPILLLPAPRRNPQKTERLGHRRRTQRRRQHQEHLRASPTNGIKDRTHLRGGTLPRQNLRNHRKGNPASPADLEPALPSTGHWQS